MNNPGNEVAKAAFEEFQLYYESTEKVTDRRLESNRWNYSICVATLVAIAVLVNWGLSKPSYIIISLISAVILSLMAALYCALWIGQIRDYKLLNNAKFEVLNAMAPQISFSDLDADCRKSFCPFEKEWTALQKVNALEEVRRTKILALKASNMEYLIPRAFRVLYICIIAAVLAFSVINRKSILVLPPIAVPQVSEQNA